MLRFENKGHIVEMFGFVKCCIDYFSISLVFLIIPTCIPVPGSYHLLLIPLLIPLIITLYSLSSAFFEGILSLF